MKSRSDPDAEEQAVNCSEQQHTKLISGVLVGPVRSGLAMGKI